MRRLIILSVLAAGLISPAFAAWQDYQVPELNFYVTFPAEPKIEPITYTAPDGTSLPGKMWSLSMDGNEYRISVVDFAGNAIKRTDIIKAAVNVFRAKGEVVEDIYARISSDFGRNLNIRMKDGSMSVSSIYFANNRKLYIIEGVKLAGTKNAYALRFKESISFIAPPGAGRGGAGGRGAAGGAGRGAAPAEGAGRGAAPADGAGRGAAPAPPP